MKNGIPTRSSQQMVLGLMIRLGVYALLLGVIAFGMLWGAVRYGPGFFDETGPVEIMETVFVLVTALIFLAAGRLDRVRAPFVCLLASLLFCAVIRESDYFLDVLICRHAWKFFVGVLFVFISLHVRRNFKSIVESLTDFMCQPCFGVLMSGLLVLVVFSRLFGYGDLWKELIEGRLYRVVKTIVEEGVELMGYFLILISAFEYVHVERLRALYRKDPAK